MRKFATRLTKLCAAGALAGLLAGSANAQVIFTQDFDGIGGSTAGGAGTYTFPAGWLLRNVDNFTPAASVSYVNDAWERREDFANAVTDSAAFSTSWYSPAGTANDWMWTPAISGITASSILKWNGVTYDASYPDGYEVRIMTVAPTGGAGSIGNQITSSTVLFSIPAENTTWTARQVSLAAYAGQTVYIGFRNNSTDEFLLLIDDVEVENAVANSAELTSITPLQYTIVPKTQVAPLTLSGVVTNTGTNALTSVQLIVNAYDGGGALIGTSTSPATASVAAGATATLTAPSWTPPSTPDFYTLEYIVDHAATDADPTDDTLYAGVLVDDSTYARDDGQVTGGLGIGAGVGGYLGNAFDVVANADLSTIGVYVTAGYTGEPLACVVWNMAAGTPNQIIASTDTLIYPDDSARYYILPMHNGPVAMTPGQYVFTFVEFDSTMQLGQTATIFTPGKMWVSWPGQAWANVEAFGGAFARASVVRPHFQYQCPAYASSTSSTDANCGASDGTASVNVTPAGTFTYLWSNGDNTASISNLAAGSYTVTVTDNNGCTVVDTAVVNNLGGPSVQSLTATPALCFGDNGTATVVATGGTPGYSYLWSNGDTTASITDVAGTYTVQITDANGCLVTSSTVSIGQPSVLGVSVSTTPSQTGSSNDGTASAAATGGTTSYTYLWSNGATTATISNLAPGTYCVTVTDANGCSTTACDTVGVVVGINNPVSELTVGVFPNPNQGTFTLSVEMPNTGSISIELFDLTGERVYNEQLLNARSFRNEISVPSMAAGTYMLKVTADGVVKTTKVVVE